MQSFIKSFSIYFRDEESNNSSGSRPINTTDTETTNDDNLVKLMKDDGTYHPIGHINYKKGKLTPIRYFSTRLDGN